MKWSMPWRRTGSEASRWFQRIHAGHVDGQIDKEFVAWMEADMKHVNDYEMCELTWELTAQLRGRTGIESFIKDADAVVRNAAKAKNRRGNDASGVSIPRRWVLAAASVSVVAMLLALYISLQPTVTEYTTNLGEQRLISLADHSTIALNTAAKVRVVYSRFHRRVELLQGEALFAVTHDASRPFEVAALKGITRAVGTQFAVQLHPMTAEVSVLEGTVLVISNEQATGSSGMRVTAGEAIDYMPQGEMSSIRAADINRIRGWQAQKIVFDGLSLVNALAEYNRYAKTPIVLGNGELGDRKIHGVFRIGDEQSFVRALEQALPLRATRTEKQIVLLARAESSPPQGN